MNWRYAEEATEEVEEAVRYYDASGEGLGQRFFDRVKQCVSTIGAHPRRYAKVSPHVRQREIRSLSLTKFPYRVVYEVFADEVVVLAVAHHRRRTNYWRRRRG